HQRARIPGDSQGTAGRHGTKEYPDPRKSDRWLRKGAERYYRALRQDSSRTLYFVLRADLREIPGRKLSQASGGKHPTVPQRRSPRAEDSQNPRPLLTRKR